MTIEEKRIDSTPISVGPGNSIREVISKIDQGKLGIALIVGENGKLIGVVTDGDIRRAILNGISLDAEIKLIMNTKYIAIHEDTYTQLDVLELMENEKIRQAPVIDKNGCLIGLYHINDLSKHTFYQNWVIIMAGGKGLRLRPLTENLPKSMLRVGKKPLLEKMINQLVNDGFKNIHLSINYLSDKIENFFKDGKEFGCHIKYLREKKILGTAGSLSLLPGFPSEPILVLNGDLITDINFSTLLEFHLREECAATQSVYEYLYEVPYGVVQCEDARVIETKEKPVYRHFINAGIYVLSPEMLKLIPEDQEYTMPELLDNARNKGYNISAFPIHGNWLDIGNPKDYEFANTKYQKEEV